MTHPSPIGSNAPEEFLIRFWGVRGSIPTPGPRTVRYGGNTTCIEVVVDGHVLVIDTGTGARGLGDALLARADGRPVEATIAYSHLHLDHIQGFPFFAPIYRPDTTLRLLACPPQAMSAREVLANQMTYPSFPVGLDNLPATLDFEDMEPGGSFQVGPATVRTCPIHHPGGAVAFRIEHRGRSFVQCSDVEHAGDTPPDDLVALCDGADALSYDSMYTEGEEYERHRGWGHSTWQAGVRVADAAGVARFIAFHHDPSHDDAFMDALGEDLQTQRPGSVVAREGLTLDLLRGEVVAPASGAS